MEQICTNIDILKTIFNYLKLEEQIKVTQVSAEFQYIIVNCMWCYKYREIKVFKLNGERFIICSINTKSPKERNWGQQTNILNYVDLNSKDFSKFIKLNQENIQELELSDYNSNGEFQEELKSNFNFIKNKWRFPQLLKLTLQYINLDSKQLDLIYKNCLKLEILKIKQCLKSTCDCITLRDQNNDIYETLLSIIRKLKEFSIEYRESQFVESTINLHDLLAHNNLKSLALNVPFENFRYNETPRLRDNFCEILSIGNFSQYKSLQKFTRLYLNSFPNLVNLTLEGSLSKIFIETQFIQNLAQACPLLKYLNLKRCLINVEDFQELSSLLEITLDNCMSLTWRNLKQLLDLPKLENFYSNYSTYTRELESITIPLNLKYLTLVANEFRFSQIFDNPHDPLPNLKALIYFDGSDSQILGLSQKIPNLETLHIFPHHIHLKDLFGLKNLKLFQVPKFHKNHDQVLPLMHLLKHPGLQELSLSGCGLNLDDELSIDLSDIKLTQIKSLTLDFDIFNYLLEFLLDLLSYNRKLKLTVTTDDFPEFDYFFDLVKKRKFCRGFIKLCGFQIDRQDFTAQPATIQRKLETIRDLSEYKNIYFII